MRIFADMSIVDILASNINSIVTLVVGLLAFAVYSKQKWDKKRNIASAILVEIKNAEASLRDVKAELTGESEDGSLPENIFLMPVESWSANRQDFIKDFQADEWSAIDAFYTKCRLYDQNAQYNTQAFAKNEEQIRVNAHRLVADAAKMLADKIIPFEKVGRLSDEQERKISGAYDIFYAMQGFVDNKYLTGKIPKPIYKPQKYLNQARLHAYSIEPLSMTNVGRKLQNIANRPWIRNILHLYTR